MGLRAGAEGIRRAVDRRRSVDAVKKSAEWSGYRCESRDCRCFPAADSVTSRRTRRDCDIESERRLSFRCIGRSGGRARVCPGADLSVSVSMFDASHGTVPLYAGQDKVNPCSQSLSAEMMLRHIGWVEAAE